MGLPAHGSPFATIWAMTATRTVGLTKMRRAILSLMVDMNPRWLASVALLTSCIHAAPPAELDPAAPCEPKVARNAAPYLRASSRPIAGHFAVQFTDTTRSPVTSGSSTLMISTPDSLQRARARGPIYPSRRSVPLSAVGWFSNDEYTAATSRVGVQLRGVVLYIGDCLDCTDATSTRLVIDGVSDAGFWGRWYSDPGIGVLMDSTGRTYPNPAGRFCARRRDDQ